MNQNYLRKKVRYLKAEHNISYKEVSQYLDIRKSSMYNWLRNQYDLSDQKALRLEEIIRTMEE